MRLCGMGIGSPCRLQLAAGLADRADPVEILGLSGRERYGPLELRHCLFRFAKLEADLAELAAQLGVLGRFLQQLEQQRPRDRELPRCHQRLHQIRARGPMARIAPERLQIKRNRILRPAAALMNDAEIAPAGDKMRRDAQGRLVIFGRGTDVVAKHEGVGERCVQIGGTIDRDADRHRGRKREPGLKHCDRGPDLAAPVMLATRAQQIGDAWGTGRRQRKRHR